MFKLAVYISKFVFVFIAVYFQYFNLAYVIKELKKDEPVEKPGFFGAVRAKRRGRKNMPLPESIKTGIGLGVSLDRSFAGRQFILLCVLHIIAFCILYNDRIFLLGMGGLAFFIIAFFAVRYFTKKSCPMLWNNVFMLMDTGFIMLLRINPDSAERQLLWFVVGFAVSIVCFTVLRLLPKFITRNRVLPYLLLVFTLAFLVLPFFFGRTINGANNWITISGYSFQPSEIAKIVFVLCLAGMLRNISKVQKDSLFRVILLCGFSAGCVLILVLQRDLGGALIFFVTFVVMLFIAAGSKLLLFASLFSVSGASVLAYQIFPHIQVRIAAWLNPWSDIDAGGYQILQSLFAMGTWGKMGSGLSLGMPGFIPVVESDFIFAAITEEFGVFFSILMICSFVFILFYGIRTALRCTDSTKALAVTGLSSLLALQTFLIIGGCIKLIPITGVTLPFISYGGSSLIVCLTVTGMLAWLSLPEKTEVTEASDEETTEAAIAAVASMFEEDGIKNRKASMHTPTGRTPLVLGTFFLLYGLTIIFLCKFVFFDSDAIVANSYNPRLRTADSDIRRGDIFDRNMNVMATTDEASIRLYPYAEKTAHISGYLDRGGAGAESRYNFTLQKIGGELIQRVSNIFAGEQIQGDSIVLTVDADLTAKIYDKFASAGLKGAAVVMEPSTGRVLAMASYPSYNPNKISEYWLSLSTDNDNNPLLNRATQGLYPPGSIFKIITAATAIKEKGNEHYESYVHECLGDEAFGTENDTEVRIRCFDQKAHGEIGLSRAFALSCNTFFASEGLSLGGQALRDTAEKVLFNKEFEFPLSNKPSSFVLDGNSSLHEMVQTSIGQGKTLVSPLHMAMLTSAVANGGIMMQPYLQDYVLTRGNIVNRTVPTKLADVFKPEEAVLLTEMMTEVVKSGTGVNATVKGVQVAGKTGTAENASGDDHGWFVAFAPADNPKVALAILLENSGGPKQALSLAKEIIEWVLAE